jgi:hypothetical protein
MQLIRGEHGQLHLGRRRYLVGEPFGLDLDLAEGIGFLCVGQAREPFHQHLRGNRARHLGEDSILTAIGGLFADHHGKGVRNFCRDVPDFLIVESEIHKISPFLK